MVNVYNSVIYENTFPNPISFAPWLTRKGTEKTGFIFVCVCVTRESENQTIFSRSSHPRTKYYTRTTMFSKVFLLSLLLETAKRPIISRCDFWPDFSDNMLEDKMNRRNTWRRAESSFINSSYYYTSWIWHKWKRILFSCFLLSLVIRLCCVCFMFDACRANRVSRPRQKEMRNKKRWRGMMRLNAAGG